MATQVKNVYRKTKEGSWAIMGPVDVVKVGSTVTVHKKDGTTKQEHIVGVGKSFDVDGVLMNYGYTTVQESRETPRQAGRCQHCGDSCNPRYKTCIECRHGGQSYYDSFGNFVLGSDD